jgi:hypothetical protein
MNTSLPLKVAVSIVLYTDWRKQPMIGYFPEAYLDELLYSVCARFSDRLQYSTIGAVQQELFGCNHLKAVVELPSNLDYLINILPPGHNYTVDKLIDNHTLLPFYRPFLSPGQLDVFRGEMLCRTRGALLSRVGNPSRHMALRRLHFCTECVEDDRKRGEECYWHRVHQVAYVKLCPIHGIPLKQSDVRSGNASIKFVSAERAVRVGGNMLDVPSAHYDLLLQIARDVAWLLQQVNLSYDSVLLRRQYLTILFNQGLTSRLPDLTPRPIRTNMTELRRRFVASYPRELLEILHCEPDIHRCDNWLSRLINHNESNRYPLYHLLFMYLLGYTAESFLSLPVNVDERDISGEGPWPCLNPTCRYYRQFCIKERKLMYVGTRPLGIISCECGFTYRRDESDSVQDGNPFQLRSVVAYGSVWEATLRSLWDNPAVTLVEIGHQLGITGTAVQQHAARLGLSFPRIGCKSDRMKMAKLAHSRSMTDRLQAKLEHHRVSWLSLVEENPTESLSELATRAPKVHRWLYLRDREWLDAHKPPSRRRLPSRSIDWASRDTQLAQEVKEAAEHLRNSSSPRPRRMTRYAILAYISRSGLTRSDLNRLPLTAKSLADLTESHEDFAIRRIWWAVELWRKENIHPTRQQLIRDANLRKIIGSLRVEMALEDALQSLVS